MNSNDFVSVNHILAEALVNVNDQDLRHGFSKGWYISRIQDALQELAFDTFYQQITKDYDFPKSKLALEIPKNAFNVREIYLFNQTCCNPSTSAVVWWKRNFNNNDGKSGGYTSRIKANDGNSLDPFMPKFPNANSYYFANVQNGVIMFSSSCQNYEKVRVIFNGMGVEIGDEPIIPRFFERYINYYIEDRYYSAMKARDPRKYRILWADSNITLAKEMEKAKMRISGMNTWQKNSLEEYISNIVAK
tara:strand:- start:272 stop:1012 length:741 start_codon:yes stop_codon:yes gene_type:complete